VRLLGAPPCGSPPRSGVPRRFGPDDVTAAGTPSASRDAVVWTTRRDRIPSPTTRHLRKAPLAERDAGHIGQPGAEGKQILYTSREGEAKVNMIHVRRTAGQVKPGCFNIESHRKSCFFTKC
jgi:hypothetical protein